MPCTAESEVIKTASYHIQHAFISLISEHNDVILSTAQIFQTAVGPSCELKLFTQAPSVESHLAGLAVTRNPPTLNWNNFL